jgi:hypothetical protein
VAFVGAVEVQILPPLLLEARHERAFFIAPASSDAAAQTLALQPFATVSRVVEIKYLQISSI